MWIGVYHRGDHASASGERAWVDEIRSDGSSLLRSWCVPIGGNCPPCAPPALRRRQKTTASRRAGGWRQSVGCGLRSE